MKKILLTSGLLYLYSIAFAVTHDVIVRNNEFSPSNLAVEVGDVVRWIHESGSHTTTSVSVPDGADTWDAPINGTSTEFSYTVEEEGTYNYQCTPHGPSMAGTFSTSPVTRISEYAQQQIDFFPNPVQDVCVVEGVVVERHYITAQDGRSAGSGTGNRIDLSGLHTGVYFVRLEREGTTVGVLRVVKE